MNVISALKWLNLMEMASKIRTSEMGKEKGRRKQERGLWVKK